MARILVGTLVIVFGAILFVAWLLIIGTLVALSPLLYVVHVALQANGRYGFGYYDQYRRRLKVRINIRSFRKVSYQNRWSL